MRKGKFYEVWTRNAQHTNTLTTVNKLVHANKRRTLCSVFSDKAVRSAETFVIDHVDRWNELLLDANSKDWSQPKNLARWSDYLLFDILGDLCFGKSFNIKEPEENPLKMIPHAIASYSRFMYPVRSKRQRLEQKLTFCKIAQSPMLNTWLWLKPRGLDQILDLIAPKEVKEYYSFITASVSE